MTIRFIRGSDENMGNGWRNFGAESCASTAANAKGKPNIQIARQYFMSQVKKAAAAAFFSDALNQ
ncbi:MAG: hypothetical protein IPI44_04960 [Sulfuritalea sp.]|nr:hypothetical protein [Sulfuritalea sp.]MBK8119687.1 hypothetical protein [Sulfuritalea sp.]